jgi:hypothetical protein
MSLIPYCDMFWATFAHDQTSPVITHLMTLIEFILPVTVYMICKVPLSLDDYKCSFHCHNLKNVKLKFLISKI